ncbi:protein kinase [Belnapia sp. T6]|uniref:Protein kinase n=1 Tax=Belnapia mucosa TaxID=2804532 RepID=A0ABS1VAH9_9PROT|nr:protein kinase [Belnapia mucosa]MBL6458645.1 protein kinase [Belnapia mucosa]
MNCIEDRTGAGHAVQTRLRLPPPHLPPEIAVRYEIRRRVGTGPDGAVYEALDHLVDRRVALRLVPCPGAEEAQPYRHGGSGILPFVAARTAARLVHPNILRIYDLGRSPEVAWIVMEFAGGESVRSLLDRGSRIAASDAVFLTSDVLAALAFAHAQDVLHGDIRPEKLFLVPDGSVKVTGFGRPDNRAGSGTGKATTPAAAGYLSPERLRGGAADRHADLWAAGIVLFELLTGRRPFEDGDAPPAGHRISEEDGLLPALCRAGVPPVIGQVVAQALATDAAARFPSAASFGRALQAASASASTEATAILRPGAPHAGRGDRLPAPPQLRVWGARAATPGRILGLPLRASGRAGGAAAALALCGLAAALLPRGDALLWLPPPPAVAVSGPAVEAGPPPSDAGGQGSETLVQAVPPRSAEEPAPATPSEPDRPAVAAPLPAVGADQAEPAPADPVAPAPSAAPRIPSPFAPGSAILMPVGANVRAGPQRDARVVRLVGRGTRLQVFERSGNWVLVGGGNDGPWGWVYLPRLGNPAAPAPPAGGPAAPGGR